MLRNKAPKHLPKNVQCFNIYTPSIRKDYYIVNSKFILTCQDSIGIFREGQRAYYLTHGAMALKNTKGNISVPKTISYILAPSEYLLPIQADLLSISYPNEKQIILGYPCHDVLHNIKHGDGDLKKLTGRKSSFNVEQESNQKFEKVIIWMPTFRKLRSGERIDSNVELTMGVPILKNNEDFCKLDEKLASKKVLLVIKIHPMQDTSKIRIRSTNNIVVLDGNTVKELGIDNYRLMVDTDAMITDYSSSGNAYEETTILYDIILIIPIVLGMRTKGFAFIAVYIFVKYSGNWLKRFKPLYWIIMGMVILAVSYSKLALYVSYSTSPRETLYLGALRLSQLCFPVGSGFATYASHISGRYFSGVYNIITIAGLYNYDGTISVAIGDAGFPYYIGQFGVIGCILIAVLFINLYKLSLKTIPKYKTTPIVLMWLMIIISLTSETILVNDGFQIAFIMSIITKALSIKYSSNVKAID